mgnify:FL=1
MSAGFKESITHAPVSSQKPYAYRSKMGMFNSAEWIVVFDDFLQAEQATENQVGWTPIIDSGATIVDGNEHGGVIDISSDGTDEGAVMYGNLGIKLNGKRFFMEARVKVEDSDDNIVAIGLSDLTSTTNPEDLWTTQSDFIAFGSVTDGDATPKLVHDKDNGGPVTVTPESDFDLNDGEWHVIAIAFNGASTLTDGSLKAYVDGVEAASATTEAQVPDDLPLAPFFGARLEDDASDIVSFDYVRIVAER